MTKKMEFPFGDPAHRLVSPFRGVEWLTELRAKRAIEVVGKPLRPGIDENEMRQLANELITDVLTDLLGGLAVKQKQNEAGTEVSTLDRIQHGRVRLPGVLGAIPFAQDTSDHLGQDLALGDRGRRSDGSEATKWIAPCDFREARALDRSPGGKECLPTNGLRALAQTESWR